MEIHRLFSAFISELSIQYIAMHHKVKALSRIHFIELSQ